MLMRNYGRRSEHREMSAGLVSVNFLCELKSKRPCTRHISLLVDWKFVTDQRTNQTKLAKLKKKY